MLSIRKVIISSGSCGWREYFLNAKKWITSYREGNKHGETCNESFKFDILKIRKVCEM